MGTVRQISLYDNETGELLSSTSSLAGSKLKEGWIVVYKEAMMRLLKEVPNFATMKVYMNLACIQDYDTVTITTTSFLAKLSGLTYQTTWNSMKWLIKAGYVHKTNVNGQVGFVINPMVSTCGKKNIEERASYFAKDDIQTPLLNENETYAGAEIENLAKQSGIGGIPVYVEKPKVIDSPADLL